MQAVMLDTDTFGTDLDDFALQQLNLSWQRWGQTGPDQVVERLAGAAVVVTNKVLLDAEILARAPQLQLIVIAATGTNNVDLQAAAAQGIVVTNIRDYAAPSVSQHVFALMFALATHLPDYQRAVKAGKWQHAQQFCLLDYPIFELQGRSLGIVGYGNLGQAVAAKAKCFGMTVLIAEHAGASTVRPGRIGFEELLSKVDVLSLHCPLVAETRQLIDARALRKMKSSALLINTARGGVVDEAALAAALQTGEIAGAGIDVLNEEPPRHGSPLLELEAQNLILTPHIAWASSAARQRVIDGVAANIQAFLMGSPINRV